jgi:S-formylglutathione hydrolase FrmB
VAEHDIIVVAAEGADGWYTDSVTAPKDKYETYVVSELVPEVDKRFRTLADRAHRYIAGLSMGGYGAVKFGLKYPDSFSVVGSFSGALGAAAYNETTRGSVGRSVMPVFGPEGSETRRANDVFLLARELTPDRIKLLPFIYLACGTEDTFLGINRDFIAILVEKKVPHEYRQHPGGHTWAFWDTQLNEFLRLVTRGTSP